MEVLNHLCPFKQEQCGLYNRSNILPLTTYFPGNSLILIQHILILDQRKNCTNLTINILKSVSRWYKDRKVYSLECTDIPKVLVILHHVGLTNVIRGHCCSLGHLCTTMGSNNENP
jgi:hypothetical protein